MFGSEYGFDLVEAVAERIFFDYGESGIVDVEAGVYRSNVKEALVAEDGNADNYGKSQKAEFEIFTYEIYVQNERYRESNP